MIVKNGRKSLRYHISFLFCFCYGKIKSGNDKGYSAFFFIRVESKYIYKCRLSARVNE